MFACIRKPLKAAPFAAAQGLPPEIWKGISLLLKGGM